MQSNLGIASISLSKHVHDLDLLLRSGFLDHSNAIVLSQTGPGSEKQDLVFFIKDLFTRLQIKTSVISSKSDKLLDQTSITHLFLITKYLGLLATSLTVFALICRSFPSPTPDKLIDQLVMRAI
ncbi:hypothetical protein Dsin_021208 [Dipteronia sinensis]|uniref:Uncharacterized protein n=1 Tax=Dipteronia sinensis TaxID=43782 RepID=A0AAD9ZZA9_9ROSI|nr:hypothetical protein Dsin_021208 [Dipteronia sinensis]